MPHGEHPYDYYGYVNEKENGMDIAVFEPYGDRILVELIPVETESAGGVVLPDAVQERPVRGTVIKFGPGERNANTVERMPMPIKEGDVVHFSKYGGIDVKIDDHLLIREADVLAVEPAAVEF